VGLGRPSAALPADDVAALVALLGRLDPEPPAELAATLGDLAGPGASAGALWRALEAAVAPAEPAQLALWLERMAPEAVSAAHARERSVAQATEEEAAAPAAAALQPVRTPPPRPGPVTASAAPPPPHGGPPAQAALPPAPPSAEPAPPSEEEPGIPGPDWFAPPTASPPPLKGAPPRAVPRPPPVPAVPASPGAPPVLQRAALVGPSVEGDRGAPAPTTRRPPGAPLTFLDLIAADTLRRPIVGVAALLGLVLGWLGGR
jgi:hypothetical protein